MSRIVRLLFVAVMSLAAAGCATPVTPSPSATTADRPIGIFVTDRAVLGTCIAVRLGADTLHTGEASAWWWDQGSSGDCSSRTSDVVSTTARIASAGAVTVLTISIPNMDGTSEDMRFAVGSRPDGLAGTVSTKSATSPVRFIPVASVDPTFRPMP
jgi:hypothetical protein